MNENHRLNLAYIISMPHGIDAWTFREIEMLSAGGSSVTLFPLRMGNGPYLPPPTWDVYKVQPRRVALAQARGLWRYQTDYLKLWGEALRSRTLPAFLLSVDFARQMQQRGVNLIHCVFGDHKLFAGYYCKKLLGTPLSVALYGYDLRANPNWPMFRRAIAACDQIVVNCEFNRRLLGEVAGEQAAARAIVVHHHADLPATAPAATVRILIVGGFVWRKGHEILFRAIKAAGQNIEVWVVGYGGPINMVQLADQCGVRDRVRIFGTVADDGLNYLYQQCDLVCLPSRTDQDGISEGLPVALIEAMAHGKPVIATRLGGTPELVEDILIEEGDVEGLAQAIQRLAADPALRETMGRRNQTIVREHFSARNVEHLRAAFVATMTARQPSGGGS